MIGGFIYYSGFMISSGKTEAIKKRSSESSGGQIAEILGPLLKNKKKK